MPSKSGGAPVRAETRERWQQLCEQAANEQDPLCLTELTCEIDQILAEKQKRLRQEKKYLNWWASSTIEQKLELRA